MIYWYCVISLNQVALMMASCNRNIFRFTGLCEGNPPVSGGFPSQRPVKRSFGVFFVCLFVCLSAPEQTTEKTIETLWFKTPSRSLWRHSNVISVMGFHLLYIELGSGGWRWQCIRNKRKKKQKVVVPLIGWLTLLKDTMIYSHG